MGQCIINKWPYESQDTYSAPLGAENRPGRGQTQGPMRALHSLCFTPAAPTLATRPALLTTALASTQERLFSPFAPAAAPKGRPGLLGPTRPTQLGPYYLWPHLRLVPFLSLMVLCQPRNPCYFLNILGILLGAFVFMSALSVWNAPAQMFTFPHLSQVLTHLFFSMNPSLATLPNTATSLF